MSAWRNSFTSHGNRVISRRIGSCPGFFVANGLVPGSACFRELLLSAARMNGLPTCSALVSPAIHCDWPQLLQDVLSGLSTPGGWLWTCCRARKNSWKQCASPAVWFSLESTRRRALWPPGARVRRLDICASSHTSWPGNEPRCAWDLHHTKPLELKNQNPSKPHPSSFTSKQNLPATPPGLSWPVQARSQQLQRRCCYWWWWGWWWWWWWTVFHDEWWWPGSENRDAQKVQTPTILRCYTPEAKP